MRWSVTDGAPDGGAPSRGVGAAAAPDAPGPPASTTAPTSAHPAVRATAAALADLGARHGVREVPAGLRTPAELAGHLGVPVAAVATTTLLRTGPDPLGTGPDPEGEDVVLLVASAVHDLVPPALAAVLGLAEVEVVGDVEVLHRSGSVLGSTSPVGLTDALRTYVDVTLAPHPTIWVPAGHPHAVFATRYDELLRLTGGHPVEIG